MQMSNRDIEPVKPADFAPVLGSRAYKKTQSKLKKSTLPSYVRDRKKGCRFAVWCDDAKQPAVPQAICIRLADQKDAFLALANFPCSQLVCKVQPKNSSRHGEIDDGMAPEHLVSE